MKCRTAGCGYFNSIDGEGWPDYVMVENDGEVFKGTYDVREYFPVNIKALLELADECEGASRAYADDGHELTSKQFANVARRIHEAIGETS